MLWPQEKSRLTAKACQVFTPSTDTPIINVGLFIVEPDLEKVLATLRAPDKEPHGSKWSIPGGRLVKNETPFRGMQREGHEETGQMFPEQALIPVATATGDAGKQYIYFIVGTRGIFKPRLNNEHTDFKWVDLADTWPNPGHARICEVRPCFHTARIKEIARESLILQGSLIDHDVMSASLRLNHPGR